MVEQKMARFEAALKALSEGLSRPRTQRVDKIHERIGRLRERYGGSALHPVHTDNRGTRAESITWKCMRTAGSIATHPGVYSLRTNETSWDNSGVPIAGLRISKPSFVLSSPNWVCGRSTIVRGRRGTLLSLFLSGGTVSPRPLETEGNYGLLANASRLSQPAGLQCLSVQRRKDPARAQYQYAWDQKYAALGVPFKPLRIRNRSEFGVNVLSFVVPERYWVFSIRE